MNKHYITLNNNDCGDCIKCLRRCPVKSIKFIRGRAEIIEEDCILCGNCYVACPQNAKEIRNDLDLVKELIKDKSNKVICSLAPSFIANYDGVSIHEMARVLKQLGFYAAEETAVGATIVKKEYERMVLEEEEDIIISSSCHSINLLIQKYYPNLLKYLAKCMSPMQAHAYDLRKRYQGCKVVFVGPCIAKKEETDSYDFGPDFCLTFDELSNWIAENDLELEEDNTKEDESLARFFPTKGGIIRSMNRFNPNYKYISVDGVSECKEILDNLSEGVNGKVFIEMSACKYSCLGGPVMTKNHHNLLRDILNVQSYAGTKDFKVNSYTKEELAKDMPYLGTSKLYPSEREISEILAKIGKTKKEHEYNCGSCGYPTCREKAIAVYQGKQALEMCLPYLKEKAESFSDQILMSSPNGIMVLNEELEIEKINKSALKIFNLTSSSGVIGEQLVRFMEPNEFVKVLTSGNNLLDKKIYLREYNKYVELSIVYDKKESFMIGLMRDITEQELTKIKKDKDAKETVEVADKVIEKQMRIVQEIASLLGETAAETKVALTKLKDSIKDDE